MAIECDVDLITEIERGLHGLCQPLTVLQCRLALGESTGEKTAMLNAIREALCECARLNAGVEAMRETLQRAAGA